MAENTTDSIGLHALSQGGVKRNKHLIFSLGQETFGIPLTQVKEVIGMVDVTPIPNVPAFFRGIINLRGRIISVVDLKTKLSIPRKDTDSKRPCIIICEFGDIVLGSIVDDVTEVYGYEESAIERNVDIQSAVSRDHITGVAKSKDKGLTLLLDIGKVLSIGELEVLRSQDKNRKAA
jgi:purine-binding chemotaxis protein CheW